MRIRTILAAAAAPAALAAVLLGTAGQASAAVTQSGHAEGTIQLTQHADSDFSGQNWALDNFAQHQVITNIVQGQGGTYSYTVQYDDHGTFTTQTDNYVGATQIVQIPQGAHGVMDGTGTVTVTGASQVPDQTYLKGLDGSAVGELRRSWLPVARSPSGTTTTTTRSPAPTSRPSSRTRSTRRSRDSPGARSRCPRPAPARGTEPYREEEMARYPNSAQQPGACSSRRWR